VTTNNDELAEKMRLMRNFGFVDYDKAVYLGINGKMNEVCAAMGLTSLESIDEIIQINQRNYLAYREGLTGLPGIELIQYDPTERNNYQYVVVEVDPEVCPINRDALVDHLHAHQVIARKYFWPGVHRMQPYRAEQPNAGMLLPNTERIAKRVIVLPTGQQTTPVEIAAICGIVRSIATLTTNSHHLSKHQGRP